MHAGFTVFIESVSFFDTKNHHVVLKATGYEFDGDSLIINTKRKLIAKFVPDRSHVDFWFKRFHPGKILRIYGDVIRKTIGHPIQNQYFEDTVPQETTYVQSGYHSVYDDVVIAGTGIKDKSPDEIMKIIKEAR